ncbi:hypothetical protein Ciccas_005296 [Cichlidogyrus casuarinus]|uniref:PAS domain-containing protein n=1 Tax=Cichlidogyrus casuarinus TaxID=1844966 RepID=A0ABD2Q925_9PLAT
MYHFPVDLTSMEGDGCLQALNGFIFIVSCDGEVFSTSQNVESYLGFHQSDILHQSVMELIHSEDREEFRNQLSWLSMLPPEHRDLTLTELMTPSKWNTSNLVTPAARAVLMDRESGGSHLEAQESVSFPVIVANDYTCIEPHARSDSAAKDEKLALNCFSRARKVALLSGLGSYAH